MLQSVSPERATFTDLHYKQISQNETQSTLKTDSITKRNVCVRMIMWCVCLDRKPYSLNYIKKIDSITKWNTNVCVHMIMWYVCMCVLRERVIHRSTLKTDGITKRNTNVSVPMQSVCACLDVEPYSLIYIKNIQYHKLKQECRCPYDCVTCIHTGACFDIAILSNLHIKQKVSQNHLNTMCTYDYVTCMQACARHQF